MTTHLADFSNVWIYYIPIYVFYVDHWVVGQTRPRPSHTWLYGVRRLSRVHQARGEGGNWAHTRTDHTPHMHTWLYTVHDHQARCSIGQRMRTDHTPHTLSAGCPMIIKLGSREEHEKDCEYAPVQCPNSSSCSVVKKDLPKHLLSCKLRCPHHCYK